MSFMWSKYNQMTEQELIDLKQKIVESKENYTKLEGRRESLMDRLSEQFGVKTIPEAKKKLAKLQKELETWDEKIQTATEELETKLHESPEWRWNTTHC